MPKETRPTTIEGFNAEMERTQNLENDGNAQGYWTNPIPLIVSRAHLYTT